MSGIIVSPIGALSSPGADPTSTALHQEIERMQAELEDLERRILRRRQCDPDEVSAPFEARAESLVDRVVSSLLEAGRSDIRGAATQSDLHAEALVYEARRHAEDTLAAARRDLAGVLDARANAIDALEALGLEVSFLPDPEPTAIGMADILPVIPEPPRAEASPPVAEVVDPPVAELAGAGCEPESLVYCTDHFATIVVGEPEPALDLTEHSATIVLGEREPALDLTEQSAAIVVEAARTDAAFDLWMSVAPPPKPSAIALGRPSTELVRTESPGRMRARWVRPLEVLLALIGAASVVVLVLLLVG